MIVIRRLAAALVILSCAMATAAQAAWDLDNERSAVQFISVKNASAGELHHFKVVSGGIADNGEAQVTIDLDSVETMVPIRNQRMRELFFETVRFPTATLTAPVPDDLATLDAGATRTVNLEVSVGLHGKTVSYDAVADVTRLADGSLRVVLGDPILVSASDFALAAGVEKLREVAGLASISTAVPVTATLVFTRE